MALARLVPFLLAHRRCLRPPGRRQLPSLPLAMAANMCLTMMAIAIAEFGNSE